MSSPPTSRVTTSARTFSEEIRGLSADALTELLQLRPDLSHPVPTDLADLAARAATDSSVNRALAQLDSWTVAVAEAMAVLPDGGELTEVTDLLAAGEGGTAPDVVDAAVRDAAARLQRHGLAWGDPSAPRLLRAVRTAMGPFPGGLAPVSPDPVSERRIDDGLAELDEPARAVIDRLVWGPPTGRVADARGRVGDPGPIGRLLRLGLLRPLDDDTVVLPREVAWRLRRPARLWPEVPGPTPPPLSATPSRSAALGERLAVGAAYELVADTEALCEAMAVRSPRVLRDGGLAVRDLTSLASGLGLPVERTRLLIEIAHGARLLAASATQVMPTAHYDQWSAVAPAVRWQQLAAAWLRMRRWPAWTTEAGRHVLGPEGGWAAAPSLRATVVAELARLEPGSVATADSLVRVVEWLRPAWRRAGWALEEVVGRTLTELDGIGALTRGAVSRLLPALLSDGELDPDVAAEFPEPGTDLVLQADLTAVTGPLHHETGRVLRLLADAESRGAAAVFRFSADSLRRAFDAGWSQQQVEQWLAEHSRSPVPQPLAYLVAEVARRHGSVRVGQAWSYLRTEDETQALTVLHHPAAAGLGLRAIAPGVLISTAEPDEVVALLRELGLHPAAEDDQGRTLTATATVRAPTPATPRTPTADPASVAAQLVAGAARSAAWRSATTDVLTALQRAVQDGRRLDISYVAADGTSAHTVAVPQLIGAGTVRLAGADGVLTVPLARISGAAQLPEADHDAT